MISVLNFMIRLRNPGSIPGRDHIFVMFLGNTPYSHRASRHPGV